MPADAGVLTIEYKLNLLAAGTGRSVRALGKVRKSGRSIVVAEGEAFALDDDGRSRLMATMTATLMVVRDRPGVRD
jgi:acyl-coenzyme A thioesterase PaaI-like protein